jgi:hypothetical protein
MKVLQLVFISLFSGLTRWNGQMYCSWVNWEARCQSCTALTRQGQGIFCANFGAPILGLPLCHKAWCAGCYCQRRGTNFSVYTGSDPTTTPNAAEESGYFTSARPGHSLFCPFECDECALFRLKGVSSRIDDKNHQILLDFIRSSNMDAFWSRSPGTVTELTIMFYEEVSLGCVYDFQMFPKPMGPFPPDYDGGVRAAIGVLHRSNRPEKHEDKLKFSSARNARSVHSNMFMASALGGANAQSVRSDKGHQALTTAPTDT